MNDPHDNAQDDRDALEKHGCEGGRCGSDGDGIPEWCAKHAPPTVTGEVPFEPDETPRSGYDPVTRSLTSMDGMAWAARKLREVEDALAVNDRACDEEIAALDAEYARRHLRITERHEAADKPFDAGKKFFTSLLTVYATQNRADVLKGLRKDAKSRPFPGGVRVGWEKKGGHLRLQEAPDAREKLIAWARANCPEATEERWDVDVQAVKKAIGKAQVPAGMERVPESETLEITFSKEKP